MAKKTVPDSAAAEKKREYSRAWKAANREKVRAAGREYSRTHREQSNAWKAANRDKINAAERKWREDNPEAYKARIAKHLATEKAKATCHAYYLAHADEIKRRAKASVDADPDRAMANKRAYYEANKAEIKERVREWNAANPEATRSRGRNYRARFKGADGSHTGDDIKDLFVKQRGHCIYCNAKLGSGYHVDHIIPLASGGSNWPSNLQLLCAKCNNRKRATDPIEFARRNGRLI